MSFQKFSYCCRLLISRNNVSLISPSKPDFFRSPSWTNCDEFHQPRRTLSRSLCRSCRRPFSLLSNGNTVRRFNSGSRSTDAFATSSEKDILIQDVGVCGFATKPKPHMTSSMHKWKKKKRKSKAQQKRELENLQHDMIKLLTKRAFQLVQNKSLLGAHRQVVTTHAFNDFALDQDHNDTISEFDAHRNSGRASQTSKWSSSFIAEALEPHIKLQDTTAITALRKEDAFPAHNKLDHDRETTVPSLGKNLDYIHFSFSDIYGKLEKQNPSTDISGFESSLQRFAAELKIVRDPQKNNEMLSSHNWVEDQSEDSLLVMENIRSSGDMRNTPGEGQPAEILKRIDSDCLQAKIDSSIPDEYDSIADGHSSISGTAETDGVNSTDLADTYSSPMPVAFSSKSLYKDVLEYSSTVSDGQRDGQNVVPSLYDRSADDASFPSGRGEKSLSEEYVAELDTLGERQGTDGQRTDGQRRLKQERQRSSVQKEGRGSKFGKGKGKQNISKEFQELIDKAFVEASCFTGCEKTAVRNLQFQAIHHKITSIDVFDKLIRVFAKKGDMTTIRSLFSMLRQQELSPTLQTYAGCLECVARMESPDASICEKLLADVERVGLDIAEVANFCSFELDEWDYVLRAIRLVMPEFSPNPSTIINKYNNELLRGLNENNDLRLEENQYAISLGREEMMDRLWRQLDMEKSGEVSVDSISAPVFDSSTDAKTKRLKDQILSYWQKSLLDSFNSKLVSYEKKAQDNINMTLFPYLKLFPPEDYVDIIFKTLKELFSSSEGYSPTQAMLQINMGRAVNRKYNVESRLAAGMDTKMVRLYELYMEEYLSESGPLDNHRLMWLRAMCQNFDTINMDMSPKKWPRYVIKGVGKFLLDMILYDLKINANMMRPRAPQRPVPAFCTIYRPDVSLTTNAEIKLHPVVMKLFKVDYSEPFSFAPGVVPMLVPPVPWISKNIGSLLLGSNALVRIGDDIHHVDALKDVKETQYSAVLDSLNTLSACAWKINTPILDLQIQLFNNKGDNLLKVSPPASEMPPLPAVTSEMSSKEKALLYRERIQLQQQKQDMHGLWCTDLYRLSIANKFRDETFWFPHSMDFRGRTYPLPPHFNHLGSDNVRGMLLFAKGKPLGDKGLDWLKIHLINLTGLKKRCSNQERLEYADSIMEDILDSADHPLTGRKWWQQSDEPWQTLACCMELAQIARHEGNIEDYVCHFPVHQDGSCNGLQHYAAIGRDQAGAESVNLHPFDIPQDVYSDVVELVERERKKDAENDVEIAQILDGFIKRKVIKQTIMTTVYGVTKFGAKLQIHRQLKDIPDFPTEKAWEASLYLTDRTFVCLREMFTATKDIQDWLTEAARQISAVLPVDWQTPLGFPVLQPYFKKLHKGDPKQDKFKPNTLKQKNAFPPNYIHSLDSTHMMLTSLYCMHAGITFVSVHDCYWTHACDVSVMNKVCREQFVNMHKQPLLEDLSEHLVELVQRAMRDPTLCEEMKKIDTQALLSLLQDVPKRGSFNLDNVLKSPYFFS
ncbi:DNA-directed RNA polymerase, mitochondrial [Aplysia californica]|uniref:DNA-directed RNA polymerase n=1 Tax=Aplysia californica TaxID=6500 RepID=A0ABM0JGS6_APLCA|nr:DNA-directed RNA polymerase, mitochondrial [Aplysia californica]